MDRRDFFKASVAGGAALAISSAATSSANAQNSMPIIKPEKIKAGDTVMIIAPSGVEYNKLRLQLSVESLEALGLKVKVAENTLGRWGYFPAEDKVRADEINQAFADKDVKAIIALKGGWGAARTLPYLDFDLIKNNPKILMGYSDVTALLNPIYEKTGLITFHGPIAGGAWNKFTQDSVREILFEGKAQHMVNPQEKGEYLTVRNNRIQTVVSGTAEGRMVGGNLTVLTALQGTPYFPTIKDNILILEDVGENIYRVDRMLTQLALGGHLDECAGVVMGGWTDVGTDGGYGDFALMDIFEHHFASRDKPVFTGALFGHIADNRTMPIGCNVKIDADAGSVTMQESAVS
ncbi:S66 peptidase family protein [Pseudemcibacter aquimaris]|uniref:S66 peptidase family protein n=1 Tax=Pseudemcibacter aquimaris TaxID=2857064 RepID=UPI00201211C0|nr:LD-carboxypeptidase [Pseudemcibacter aquimaris]MCC3860914.1 LD-carboxypeptidase [Pseudemcibacter aquimaris]WDU59733.1 LD-carboxypeptidase [Pseudemcibacter aquimaris]